MENNVFEHGKLLFESKGMPSKLKRMLLVIGIILILLSVVGMVYTMSIPKRTYKPGKTEMINGAVVSTFGTYHGISDEARSKLIISCVVIFCVGAVFLALVVAGQKFYFNIYENYVEGCSGVGFLQKKINVPIQKIGEVTSNKQGLIPALMIRTVHGNFVSMYMDADKVEQAEEILRCKINI